MSESLIMKVNSTLTKVQLTRIKNVIHIDGKPLPKDIKKLEPIFTNDVDTNLHILGFNEERILLFDVLADKFMWKKPEAGSINAIDSSHTIWSFGTSEAEILKLCRSIL